MSYVLAMPVPVSSPGKPTILVVEDEILIRIELADELRDQGYAVIEAADANEALSILRSNAGVDVLVTDIRMPRGTMDGLALAGRVRTEYPAMKVLITSAHMSRENGRELFDGFFPKPCNVIGLIGHIEGLLDRRN